MNRPKSRRRTLHDPQTPTVCIGERYYDPGFKIMVHDIGKPETCVTFTLSCFQVQSMLRQLRSVGEAIGVRYRQMAEQHEQATK